MWCVREEATTVRRCIVTIFSLIPRMQSMQDKNWTSKHKDKLPFYLLGLSLFRQHVLVQGSVLRRAVNLMLDVIRRDRNGDEVPDKALLKAITEVDVKWLFFFVLFLPTHMTRADVC